MQTSPFDHTTFMKKPTVIFHFKDWSQEKWYYLFSLDSQETGKSYKNEFNLKNAWKTTNC